MSQKIEIAADKRTDVGKGASRRLRRSGMKVPGIIYGGNDGAEAITLDAIALAKAMQSDSFFSQIIAIKTAGSEQPAIVRDIQRHPASERVVHIDFQRIDVAHEIDLDVPLHFIHEDVCDGVRLGGGTIIHNLNEVGIRCLPGDLPGHIEVDMTHVGIGEAIHLSDLKLPEGVQIIELIHGPDHDQLVATVQAARAEVEEEEQAPGTEEVPTVEDEERSDED
jgi:large subunit ribosomal protein L25